MKSGLGIRYPTQAPIVNDNSGATIPTASYLELTSSLPQAASAIEVQNTSAKIIRLAVGAAGVEVVKYAIAPGVNSVIIPLELKKGARLAAKAVTADATTGALVINFLG